MQWHDDEISVAACLMSLVSRQVQRSSYLRRRAGQPEQEIILAIRKSAKENGHPVSLPLDVQEVEG